MLKDGHIVPSKCPWSSPIVLIDKKDDSIRLCVDYRKLNDITQSDGYPIHRIGVSDVVLISCFIMSVRPGCEVRMSENSSHNVHNDCLWYLLNVVHF
jgi:hypothetical protein